MAMIECPECGKEVSDKAYVCPHCGYDPSRVKEVYWEKMRIRLVLGLVALLVVLFVVLFGPFLPRF